MEFPYECPEMSGASDLWTHMLKTEAWWGPSLLLHSSKVGGKQIISSPRSTLSDPFSFLETHDHPRSVSTLKMKTWINEIFESRLQPGMHTGNFRNRRLSIPGAPPTTLKRAAMLRRREVTEAMTSDIRVEPGTIVPPIYQRVAATLLQKTSVTTSTHRNQNFNLSVGPPWTAAAPYGTWAPSSQGSISFLRDHDVHMRRIRIAFKRTQHC